MNNNIETIYNNSSSPSEYISAYFKHLTQILTEWDLSSIEKFIGLLLSARKEGKNVYFIGNGGSAATA